MSTSVVVLCCYWIKGASAIFCLLLMVLVLLSIHLQFGLFSICKREAWRQWWPQPSEKELLQMVVGWELLQMVDYCYWRRRHACRVQHNAYSCYCQCNAMQCNAMQCNAMRCNAMQCLFLPLPVPPASPPLQPNGLGTAQCFAASTSFTSFPMSTGSFQDPKS